MHWTCQTGIYNLVMSSNSTSETFEVVQHRPISRKKVYLKMTKNYDYLIPEKTEIFIPISLLNNRGWHTRYQLVGHRSTKKLHIPPYGPVEP
jgi:hypothetical protein